MNNQVLLQQPWLKWAIEIQAIAQNGVTYATGIYDIERYEQLRQIAAEMLSYQTDIPVEKVKTLFCNETGYQTPKIDTRAAIFEDDKILLVQESDGLWALPGGWCDVQESLASNTIKEVKEEAGLNAEVTCLIAILDHHKHNQEPFPYGVLKAFILCRALGGEFQANSETLASGYFALDNLPPLTRRKTTRAQLELCFAAYCDPNWQTIFD